MTFLLACFFPSCLYCRIIRAHAIDAHGVGNGTEAIGGNIVSTSPPVHQGTGLSPDEDLRYEVVDNQVVELAPMGAYEVWLATSLASRLETFARQQKLGRAVQEMLFDTSDFPWLSCLRMPKQLRSHILPPLDPRCRLPNVRFLGFFANGYE